LYICDNVFIFVYLSLREATIIKVIRNNENDKGQIKFIKYLEKVS